MSQAKLSQDEKDCLSLFARGSNENDIAEAMDLSATEISLYLNTARHKLACVSVGQAVEVAIATEAIAL